MRRVETQSIRDVAIGSIARLRLRLRSFVAVMSSAQRYCKFVADLAPHRAGLGKSKMVGVSGASTADQTRLRCHEIEVRFIAMAAWFTDGEFALWIFVRF
jgi:hypothetical protein